MNKNGGATSATATSSETTIFSLLHAAHALEDQLEAALSAVGLSSPKFSVLSELVSADEALSLSELASRLSCVRSNMTQLVDRLESDGLVRRVSCPHDRRSVKAEITDMGRSRQSAGVTVVDSLNAAIAVKIDGDDREALQRMLSALG